MGDRNSTLAITRKGGECRVQGVGTKTTVVVNSDCWLPKVGVNV